MHMVQGRTHRSAARGRLRRLRRQGGEADLSQLSWTGEARVRGVLGTSVCVNQDHNHVISYTTYLTLL